MNITKVIPVRKNGAKNEFNIYTPTLLLPQYFKIHEKLLDLRKEKFIYKFDNNGYLYVLFLQRAHSPFNKKKTITTTV